MRSKLVVLLVSPHFQRAKTNEPLLVLMKWAPGWWIFLFFNLSTYIKSCILYFLLYFILCYTTFLTKEIFFPFSIYGISPSRDCKQNVGAAIDTLMSISEGLGPSIFCQKIEKARPMREEMDGKVHFPPESAFLNLMLYFKKELFPICILSWRVNNVFCQEKV